MPGSSKQQRTGRPADTRQLCGSPDPIAVIEEEHAVQLELCSVLEFLADSLPNAVDPRLASLAVTILRNGLKQHTSLEEEGLFPLLRRRIGGTAHLLAMLDQLTAEHEADEGLAIEIADALDEIVAERPTENPEMLGYMLRGFFENQRRHIEWENNVVLPLARNVLNADDLGELQARIMATKRPLCTRQSLPKLRRLGDAAKLCRSCAAGLPRSSHLSEAASGKAAGRQTRN